MDARKRFRWWLVIGAWMLVIVLAFAVDRAVAQYVRESGIAGTMRSSKLLRQVMRAPGEYWFTISVMAGMFFHASRWRASLLVFVGTSLMGVNCLMRWGFGRFRPYKSLDMDRAPLAAFDFHPFANGLHGMIIGVPNTCLPSGHTCLAFATAATASILLPRGRWLFYGLACMVGVERVLQNAHWLSDVVVAAALGAGGGWIARRLVWERIKGVDGHGFAVPVTGDSRLQRAGKHPHAAGAGRAVACSDGQAV